MVNKTEEELRLKRVCFTGHRPEKLGMTEKKAKELLRKEIETAIEDGYITFISGMARGIDMWAAEIVLKIRKKNPQIHLICASPYENFESKWNNTDKELYLWIMKKADIVRFISSGYSYSCFQKRNEWMVDRCQRVIAGFNGTSGGTKNTLRYAYKKGREIRNIFE